MFFNDLLLYDLGPGLVADVCFPWGISTVGNDTIFQQESFKVTEFHQLMQVLRSLTEPRLGPNSEVGNIFFGGEF